MKTKTSNPITSRPSEVQDDNFISLNLHICPSPETLKEIFGPEHSVLREASNIEVVIAAIKFNI